MPLDEPWLDREGKHLASLASTQESVGLGVAIRVPGQDQRTADRPSDVKFEGRNDFDFEEWGEERQIFRAVKNFVQCDTRGVAGVVELFLAHFGTDQRHPPTR